MSESDSSPGRVLLILENAGAGSGRHVLDLARGLTARGSEVTLLFSRSRLEGWFEAELATLPQVVTKTLPMRPGLGLRDLGCIASVRRFIRENGPFDVIHGHSSKGGALARLAAPRLPGAVVYTPHAFYTLGAPRRSLKGGFYATLERILARLSDGIICVSQAEHRHAQALGLPARKLFTVPNGLDGLPPVDRAAVRARLGLSDEEVCIGFVGRLAPQKAVERLIQAFGSALRERPNLRLVVVGSGPDRAALQQIVERDGIGGSVLFTGAASGVEMMGAFDLFALTSRYEAFPYVLLEAMLRGLPILSMRVGGVDELIHDGENGFVVEQGDTGRFAELLHELTGSVDRRRAMGARSQEIVAGFDIDTMVDRTLAVYRDLQGRR